MAKKKEPLSENEKQLKRFETWIRKNYRSRKMMWLTNYIEYLRNNAGVSMPEGVKLTREDALIRAEEIKSSILMDLKIKRDIG